MVMILDVATILTDEFFSYENEKSSVMHSPSLILNAERTSVQLTEEPPYMFVVKYPDK